VVRTGNRPDGLALFWRSTRLRLLRKERINFEELGLKDNVGQLALLELRGAKAGAPGSTPPAIAIANIHVLFNPNRGDIKLGQARTLAERVDRLAREHGNGGAPVIMCGDFNSSAGSPLHTFMLRGELDLAQHDRRKISGQVEGQGRGWPALQAAMAGSLFRDENAEAFIMGDVNNDDTLVAALAALPRHVSGAEADVAARPSGSSPLPQSISSPGSRGTGSSSKPPKPWTREELLTAIGPAEDSSQSADPLRGGPAATTTTTTVRHPLHLSSAYLSVQGRELVYSFLCDRSLGTVDYIFFTPEAPGSEAEAAGQEHGEQPVRQVTLHPVAVLRPPPLRTLRCSLPDGRWPSDHISLVADFVVRDSLRLPVL
jgi:hypothetical protein